MRGSWVAFLRCQAYVALSRTTTLEGLHLLDFDRSKIVAHPRVAEFYARLRVSCSRQLQALEWSNCTLELGYSSMCVCVCVSAAEEGP